MRNVDGSWHDNKKLLRKDQRWSDCELIDRSEKQKLHEEHIKALTKKNREMFHRLLSETPDITLTSQWKDVKKLVKGDPRYSKFSSSDRVRCCVFTVFWWNAICTANILITVRLQ